MVNKTNFTIFNNADDPFTGLIFQVNEGSGGWLVITLLIMIYIVAAYIFLRRTQDISKSLISSLHIIVTLSLLLFYLGLLAGYVLIPEILMLGLLVIEALSIAGIYYNRINQ